MEKAIFFAMHLLVHDVESSGVHNYLFRHDGPSGRYEISYSSGNALKGVKEGDRISPKHINMECRDDARSTSHGDGMRGTDEQKIYLCDLISVEL